MAYSQLALKSMVGASRFWIDLSRCIDLRHPSMSTYVKFASMYFLNLYRKIDRLRTNLSYCVAKFINFFMFYEKI